MEDRKFDVIITTYNRPAKLKALVEDILKCSVSPQNIIIVDSSEHIDTSVEQISSCIRYVRSMHKNQPFQRYLGYCVSLADIVIFFDDDIEIVDINLFEKYLRPYENSDVVGVSVGIDYRNIASVRVDYNYSHVEGFNKKLLWLFWTITGNPALQTGKIFLAGLSGGIPPDYNGKVQYFQGANMSFRRSVLKDLFDDEVFSFYEMKIGKGEDKMLSMRANQFGVLYAVGDLCLRHPPEESHYYKNLEDFHKRTAFSRLYLSKIYCCVMGIPWWVGIVHYYWFSMWRLFFSLVRVISHQAQAFGILRGQWRGIVLGTHYLINADSYKSSSNWRKEKN